MIFGDFVDLKLPHICLTGEENSRKNATQDICPDRRPNLGPLGDRRACYSGGPTYMLDFQNRTHKNTNLIGPLVAEICLINVNMQTVPCALGFEVKHSKFFCRSFRTWIIILSMYFTINELFWFIMIGNH